jgi:hypothetical protein
MPYRKPPKAWLWGMRAYIVGYWLYIVAAGFWAWSQIPTFGTWAFYMLFQLIYAFFWPILVPLSLAGVRW